ncbi:hypothetical protein JR316_0000973 [Psilocybe cubensis]|uniref:Uncharacterized protein n=2 Tax=Psilocybe cubensis TaxID=181762 RepID=A0A8H7YB07_PSICU|nr:hypothetical protein JR316_0000973 [Psilocybe cubensis]KAH9486907.1 hypothetical protein JR316_0000973 [Psilocybe cubensis]
MDGPSPTPISPSTVHVILDYLSPLSVPIPPHLLSRLLLQRHHFLNLAPDNPEEYLAWPSEHRSHAIHLLQTTPFPAHDNPLPVHYLPDPENIQAHVRITPDLRLVFLWDKDHGWQYHNLALMPFPPNSYSSFNDSLLASSIDDFLPEQSEHSVSFNVEDDDDSYWNSYGQGDEPNHHSVSAANADQNLSSEDAYWAQYSAVQGSGDSTLPSPRPHPNKQLSSNNVLPERIIVASDEFQNNKVEVYNPLEPPAPASLARRLEALSAGSGAESPPLFDNDDPTSDSAIASPLDPVPALTSSSSTASPKQSSSEEFVVLESNKNSIDDATQNILCDNIKGLYRLWKLNRPNTVVEDDKEVFLATVRQALQQL